jgi:superfamily I DNA and/or RNA helicase
VNKFEVEMSLRIVKYMLHQGYKPSQLVVLTPYLGQLQELRSALKKDKKEVEMSKRDLKDLQSALQDQDSVVASDQKGVRVATIDNYQVNSITITISFFC